MELSVADDGKPEAAPLALTPVAVAGDAVLLGFSLTRPAAATKT